MKITVTILISGLFLIANAGCNGQNNVQPSNNLDPAKVSYQDQKDSTSDNLNFSGFDLTIDYGTNRTYQINFSDTASYKKAFLQDLDGQQVTGTKAFNQLITNFHKFSFDEDTKEDDVVEEVTRSLGVPDQFRTFQLKVMYNNGYEKIYKKRA
ncbi:YusW family protein [Halobacillus rhizosphaerae]|uniref:YusW family protein n=1 Tax=Halobacillus rhizosphaerae TaxID=3064889 RepID=UPI00398A91A7